MMLNNSEVNSAVEDLARCPRCGKLRTLVDLRSESKRLGMTYPDGQPYNLIECCGFDLSIEDDELYHAVVAFLQRAQAETAGQ